MLLKLWFPSYPIKGMLCIYSIWSMNDISFEAIQRFSKYTFSLKPALKKGIIYLWYRCGDCCYIHVANEHQSYHTLFHSTGKLKLLQTENWIQCGFFSFGNLESERKSQICNDRHAPCIWSSDGSEENFDSVKQKMWIIILLE